MAPPPDVRKVCDLPLAELILWGCAPFVWKHLGEVGAEPQPNPMPFRKVTDLPHIGGQSPPEATRRSLLKIRLPMNFKIHELKFDEHGLVPAIVQDANTREILTLAYMNAESLQRTIETNETWFWSRSRNQLWHKGGTSGNTQRVVDVLLDCDEDALVVLVEPAGPACHTGARTCFHNAIESDQSQGARAEGKSASATVTRRVVDAAGTQDLGGLLDQLYALIESRKHERPSGSYTTYLFNEGLDKILKKLGEESVETIIAAKNPGPELLIAETADLLYHILVLLVERNVTLDQIQQELTRRQGRKGE